jgi:hypothetical protein
MACQKFRLEWRSPSTPPSLHSKPDFKEQRVSANQSTAISPPLYPEHSLHREPLGYRFDQESDIRCVFTGLFAVLGLREQHKEHVHRA